MIEPTAKGGRNAEEMPQVASRRIAGLSYEKRKNPKVFSSGNVGKKKEKKKSWVLCCWLVGGGLVLPARTFLAATPPNPKKQKKKKQQRLSDKLDFFHRRIVE